METHASQPGVMIRKKPMFVERKAGALVPVASVPSGIREIEEKIRSSIDAVALHGWSIMKGWWIEPYTARCCPLGATVLAQCPSADAAKTVWPKWEGRTFREIAQETLGIDLWWIAAFERGFETLDGTGSHFNEARLDEAMDLGYRLRMEFCPPVERL